MVPGTPRTGALGAGRGDQGGARQIAGTAEALLGQAFNDASNSGDLRTVEAAAILARQYGWELVNDVGVTSSDALIVFGTE